MRTYPWSCKRCGAAGECSFEPESSASVSDALENQFAQRLHAAHHAVAPECLPLDGLTVLIPALQTVTERRVLHGRTQ